MYEKSKIFYYCMKTVIPFSCLFKIRFYFKIHVLYDSKYSYEFSVYNSTPSSGCGSYIYILCSSRFSFRKPQPSLHA